MAKQDRGFASMHPDKVRAIAALGGKAAQKTGKAHRWTPEEARAAGRKGGLVPRQLQTPKTDESAA